MQQIQADGHINIHRFFEYMKKNENIKLQITNNKAHVSVMINILNGTYYTYMLSK